MGLSPGGSRSRGTPRVEPPAGQLGGTNPKELGKPYDIAVPVDGIQRHCEVKGDSMLIDTVELTINEVNHGKGGQPRKGRSTTEREVNHGKDCPHVALIVVDGLDVYRAKTTGEIQANGGRRRVWTA
jgi:hypothetical protein